MEKIRSTAQRKSSLVIAEEKGREREGEGEGGGRGRGRGEGSKRSEGGIRREETPGISYAIAMAVYKSTPTYKVYQYK